ncbi:MAG TPA: PKD domain-containing protein [Gemmatimonadales bacterium]|nr:PKD domain-containing protein [Gemmatimonadales bacterium]
MRSIGLLAAVAAGTLVLASSCSEGSGLVPPENEAPVAIFTVPPCTIDVACTFTSSSTDDEQVTRWSWDFDGDGEADADTPEASFTYKTAKDFKVSLTVYDAQGLSQTRTSDITIAPAPVGTPPTAGFTHSCDGPSCTFVNTSTDVAPGTIATHAWTFGDGGTSDQASPSHTYTVSAATEFTVTLTVTDDEGASDSETQTITVTPAAQVDPPSAGFTSSCTVAVCTFVSTSTDAAPGTIVSYAWTFGDGGTAAVKNPSHTYSVTGRTDFTVALTVTDDEGATAVATRTITVDPTPTSNTPPTSSFSYSCAAAACTFISTAKDPDGAPIAKFAWTFGDGAEAVGNNPAHTYIISAVTEFTVTLTVTDNQGATAVASKTITVNPDPSVNTPPTASFTAKCYGEGCIFLNNSTDASPGAIASYAWDYGDGTTSVRGQCFPWIELCGAGRVVYSISGTTTFTVTLTVTDNLGAVAVATKQVTVTPLPPAVQGCTTSGRIVECVLDIPARSNLRVTILGVSCDLGEQVNTPPPIWDLLFINVCRQTVGYSDWIWASNDQGKWLYQAGTQARIWFQQGVSNHALNPAEGRLEGTFPSWTIRYEDGDHPGTPGEPDFTDLVLGVEATTVR